MNFIIGVSKTSGLRTARIELAFARAGYEVDEYEIVTIEPTREGGGVDIPLRARHIALLMYTHWHQLSRSDTAYIGVASGPLIGSTMQLLVASVLYRQEIECQTLNNSAIYAHARNTILRPQKLYMPHRPEPEEALDSLVLLVGSLIRKQLPKPT